MKQFKNLNVPRIIGHRGVKDLAPENTLYSINQAMKFGLKWVEIDVKISKDKIPFLLHDDNLDRTTSGDGSPLNYKYKDIFNLDAGSWFDSEYKNLYPPTLKEVLNYWSKKNQNKLNYIYLLTPKGITTKTTLTMNFMKRKMREYDELKKEIKG